MKVVKRDKTIEEFQYEKIINAIEKAFKACGCEFPDGLKDDVVNMYEEDDECVLNVEEIQDDVEDLLMQLYPSVAKCYIIYRYNHKLIRENKDKLMKDITKKLMANDIENQNANVDENSFGGRMGEAARVVTKNYALDYCMSRKSRKNHIEGEIYIHDLDSYAVGMHNCLSLPIDHLLEKGFNTRQTDVRPANSINTAMQLVAVLFQLQSLQQFGGVSATHLDWSMVPYVKKSFYKHYKRGMKYILKKDMASEYNNKLSIEDELYKKYEDCYEYALCMTKAELNQAVEGLYHNLN